jgi:hypothetical protein
MVCCLNLSMTYQETTEAFPRTAADEAAEAASDQAAWEQIHQTLPLHEVNKAAADILLSGAIEKLEEPTEKVEPRGSLTA